MRRIIMLALLASLGVAAPAAAQEANPNQDQGNNQAEASANATPAPLSMTPEIQQYLQQLESREAAKLIIWQRAAYRAAQREMRMAWRQWYGVSLARPIASSVPHTDNYSPFWPGPYAYPHVGAGYGPSSSYQFNIYQR